MAKENMSLGEGFAAQVIKPGAPQTPEPATRHYVIGWSLVAAILAALGYYGGNAVMKPDPLAPGMVDKPELHETFIVEKK